MADLPVRVVGQVLARDRRCGRATARIRASSGTALRGVIKQKYLQVHDRGTDQTEHGDDKVGPYFGHAGEHDAHQNERELRDQEGYDDDHLLSELNKAMELVFGSYRIWIWKIMYPTYHLNCMDAGQLTFETFERFLPSHGHHNQ